MSLSLDELMARPGLAPETRILVLATVRMGPGDWPALRQSLAHARDIGVQRGRVEEVLLQGTLFFGFPRAVTAFETLTEAWPATAPPCDDPDPVADRGRRGRDLFDRIYGDNAGDVHALLTSFHPEFHDFVIESAYGRVLSRPALPPLERELCAVGALAVLDQQPQLIAHARGAMRFGADEAAIREALLTAVGTRPVIQDWLRRIAR